MSTAFQEYERLPICRQTERLNTTILDTAASMCTFFLTKTIYFSFSIEEKKRERKKTQKRKERSMEGKKRVPGEVLMVFLSFEICRSVRQTTWMKGRG